MKFHLNHIIPHPLSDQAFDENSVWNNDLIIDSSQSYLIKANSGKGKSTFISLLYGIRNDFEGTLTINGTNSGALTAKDWSDIRTNKLSIVFQDMQLFNELSVWDNLLIKNYLTNHKTENEILGYLSTLGISDKKEQLCGTLSLGQQQRVAIIRSLLQPFDFLLMDEPFSHLDDENAQKSLKLIGDVCKKQSGKFLISTLGSSHQINDIQTLTI